MRRVFLVVAGLLALSVSLGLHVHRNAAAFTHRSDTISTSAPTIPASHTIRFTTVAPIPAQGTITIDFASPAFTVPTLDVSDVDVLVQNTQQPIALNPGTGSGSAWGMQSTAGAQGSITLTLNDTDGVAGNSAVEIRIGTNALYGAAGTHDIPNPASIGSYPIRITTATASNTAIESDTIPIVIAQPVGITSTVGASTQAETPVFTPPAGTFANQVTVAITTSTPGASIYYTTDGTTPTTQSTLYTAPLVLLGTTTLQAIAVAVGYTDSAVAQATYVLTPPQPSPGAVVIPPAGPVTIDPGSTQSTSISCGGAARISLFIPPQAFPAGSRVTVFCLHWSSFPIKTGAENMDALADAVFGITAEDAAGHPITTPRHPLYARLAYAPSMLWQHSGTSQLAFFAPQQRWNTAPISAITDNDVSFETIMPTIGHLAILYPTQASHSDCAVIAADINCDGAVNVVDLSILMSYWQETTALGRADIHTDGIVNLLDLTLLFFWWSA